MEAIECVRAASGWTMVGFGAVAVLVLWLGDWLGRKFPDQWQALRGSLKRAGQKLEG